MLGFLNVLKPAGITAHDVVNRVRKATGVRQVGHAGTLDPLASGVLPVAVGKACRLIRFLPSDKVYLAEVLFGVTTTTDDLEGDILDKSDNMPDIESVVAYLKAHTGKQMQKPPFFSAVHYKGERLYSLARKGVTPDDVKARAVTISQMELVEAALPVIRLRVSCSEGTYIRSIARDMGQALGSGGCLKALVREAAGPFRLECAIPLEVLDELALAGELGERIINPCGVLGLTSYKLDSEQAKRVSQGQSVQAALSGKDRVLATDDNHLLAICRWEDGHLHPEVVIANG